MKQRKMAMVAKQVKMGEEDGQDIRFWLGRPAAERMAEVTRLRRAYYGSLLGTYPEHIEKTVSQRKIDV